MAAKKTKRKTEAAGGAGTTHLLVVEPRLEGAEADEAASSDAASNSEEAVSAEIRVEHASDDETADRQHAKESKGDEHCSAVLERVEGTGLAGHGQGELLGHHQVDKKFLRGEAGARRAEVGGHL